MKNKFSFLHNIYDSFEFGGMYVNTIQMWHVTKSGSIHTFLWGVRCADRFDSPLLQSI